MPRRAGTRARFAPCCPRVPELQRGAGQLARRVAGADRVCCATPVVLPLATVDAPPWTSTSTPPRWRATSTDSRTRSTSPTSVTPAISSTVTSTGDQRAHVSCTAHVDGPADAPPLVLLGSVGGTAAMWTPVLGPLVEQFRVVRIDHRGHGDSARRRGRSGRARLDDLGDDVLATLDDLGLERVELAGLSLGGMLGMWLAIHRPERIGRLALLCTSAYLPPAQACTTAPPPCVPTGWPRSPTGSSPGGSPPRSPHATATAAAAARHDDRHRRGELRTVLRSDRRDGPARRPGAHRRADARHRRCRRPGDTTRPCAGDRSRNTRRTPGDRRSRSARATYEQPGTHRRVAARALSRWRDPRARSTPPAARSSGASTSTVHCPATTSLTAPFQEFLTRYAWGDVWSRPELAGVSDRSHPRRTRDTGCRERTRDARPGCTSQRT